MLKTPKIEAPRRAAVLVWVVAALAAMLTLPAGAAAAGTGVMSLTFTDGSGSCRSSAATSTRCERRVRSSWSMRAT